MKLLRETNEDEKQPHPPKNGFKDASHLSRASGSVSGMQDLSPFKDGTQIDFVLVPDGEDHAHPDMSQGANGHTVAFSSFRLRS